MDTRQPMDTVATILAAVRGAKVVVIRHEVGFMTLEFIADRTTFLESFAKAGMVHGQKSGYFMREATTERAVLDITTLA